jgi:hypothetical protein
MLFERSSVIYIFRFFTFSSFLDFIYYYLNMITNQRSLIGFDSKGCLKYGFERLLVFSFKKIV